MYIITFCPFFVEEIFVGGVGWGRGGDVLEGAIARICGLVGNQSWLVELEDI